ncbi:MAG: hypothetical protein NT007_01020 [Candidatus Kapabacteria bacterium]|nr:hypothetical protein [Candidatus Kapabacteria bacterium]
MKKTFISLLFVILFLSLFYNCSDQDPWKDKPPANNCNCDGACSITIKKITCIPPGSYIKSDIVIDDELGNNIANDNNSPLIDDVTISIPCCKRFKITVTWFEFCPASLGNKMWSGTKYIVPTSCSESTTFVEGEFSTDPCM